MSGRAFPILTVPDLPAAQAFWTRLGFTEAYRFPAEGPADFVALDRDGDALGLGRAGSGSEPVAYWVYVEDVDATVAALRADGVDVVAEPRDEPWGERVAAVRDPAGTWVHLGADGIPG